MLIFISYLTLILFPSVDLFLSFVNIPPNWSILARDILSLLGRVTTSRSSSTFCITLGHEKNGDREYKREREKAGAGRPLGPIGIGR